jgi:hypothetical protein
VGNPLRIAQPATTAERCAVARRLLRETAAGGAAAAGVEVYVDGAEGDGFDAAFRAWPTRFFALQGGTVRWRARWARTGDRRGGGRLSASAGLRLDSRGARNGI